MYHWVFSLYKNMMKYVIYNYISIIISHLDVTVHIAGITSATTVQQPSLALTSALQEVHAPRYPCPHK